MKNAADRVSPDRVSADRVSTDRVSTDRVSPDRVSHDRVSSFRAFLIPTRENALVALDGARHSVQETVSKTGARELRLIKT